MKTRQNNRGIFLDQEPQTELVAQLSQEFYNHNLFQLLVVHLSKLDFEVRPGLVCKVVFLIFAVHR